MLSSFVNFDLEVHFYILYRFQLLEFVFIFGKCKISLLVRSCKNIQYEEICMFVFVRTLSDLRWHFSIRVDIFMPKSGILMSLVKLPDQDWKCAAIVFA